MTEGEFARWYDAYPRHQDRDKAKKAYKAARQRGASTEALLAGAQRYREDPNREPAFTKYPATWLNNGSWQDEEPLPPRSPGEPAPQPKSVRERWADA